MHTFGKHQQAELRAEIKVTEAHTAAVDVSSLKQTNPIQLDAALLVRFYGRIKGVAEDKLDKTVMDLMLRLGLSEPDAMKPVGTYSGGMKRKPGNIWQHFFF